MYSTWRNSSALHNVTGQIYGEKKKFEKKKYFGETRRGTSFFHVPSKILHRVELCCSRRLEFNLTHLELQTVEPAEEVWHGCGVRA